MTIAIAAVAAVIILLLLVNLTGLLVIGTRVTDQGKDSRHLETRLTRLETRVDNLPTNKDVTDLRKEIAGVKEATGEVSGQVTAVTTMLKTIHDHLLETN